MSRYDFFQYSSFVANEFYNNNHSNEDCLKQFMLNLDNFCTLRGVSYTKEQEMPIGSSITFVFSPGVFRIMLLLNKNGEPTNVNFYTFAFKYINEIRDSIWDTKTIFGLPVFNVMSRDEDFENNPRNFYVGIISRSLLSVI